MVSLATDRVMMGKTVFPLFLGCFHPFLFILAGNDDMHKRLENSNFDMIGPSTAE